MNDVEEYKYKIINGILRQKVKELQEYIIELENQLEQPGLKENAFKARIAEISKKARTKRKKK